MKQSRRVPPRAAQRRPAIYRFGFDEPGEILPCWLAQHTDTPCGGRMEHVHLIPKARIKRDVEVPEGVDARSVLWDRRVLVAGCNKHHGELDVSRRLRLAREDLPVAVEEYAREHGLTAYLDRAYGVREGQAA